MRAPRHPSWAVVAGWGLLNLVLFAVLLVYGESLTGVVTWACSLALLATAAALVRLASLRRPEENRAYRVPVGGGSVVVPAAVGLMLMGVSLAYGPWLVPLGVPWVAVAVALEVKRRRADRRRRDAL